MDDSVGAQDLDDKMGDEKVKVMSLAEYEALLARIQPEYRGSDGFVKKKN